MGRARCRADLPLVVFAGAFLPSLMIASCAGPAFETGSGEGGEASIGAGGSAGSIGDGGSGQGGSGDEGVCTPNVPACDGNRATTCNAEGTGYADGMACSSSQSCSGGTCYERECEPGKAFCSGNGVRRCAADGLSSEEQVACGSDEYCATSSAECRRGACEPNTPACDETRATTCNAEGTGFAEDGEVCGADTTCDAGVCKPHACAPGEQFCRGQDVRRCAENGLGSAIEETCVNQTCVEASSTASCESECMPGQERCADDGVQTCSATGRWETAVPCPESTPDCRDGTCTTIAGAATAIDLGYYHTCVLLEGGRVRCWGFGQDGRLGYGNTRSVGDDETPASAGDVDVGGMATQIAAGGSHTCALLEGGSVRCWGLGEDGQLGYGNTNTIGDDETPASAGDVDVGGTVTQIAAGGSHTCALLEGGSVRCWGLGLNGRLGYGNENNVGDDETPASAGDVDVGGTVTQIAAGGSHTCALLEGGSVRCWGSSLYGQLGYGDTNDIGDNEMPASAGDVDVGGMVTHIAAGSGHTCGLLEGGSVRCWGYAYYGQLGYAAITNVGDTETPASAGDVDVGGTVTQIAAGGAHTCTLLEGGHVRCWGDSRNGRLGYGNTFIIGDNETPASAGDVDVGGTVTQIAAGGEHTCALLEGGSVRCWGSGNTGQLGYGNYDSGGYREPPASAGDVQYR